MKRKKEVIDLGEAGRGVKPCFELSDAIYETGGKLVIIFANEKYIVFVTYTLIIVIKIC
ncbi:hypothetical protein J6Y73_04435 [bacterium]|nr:hypothetical protein [bacterium]